MMAPYHAALARGSERDDLAFLMEARHTDVEFLMENGTDPPQTFRAHKTLLAMRNEVFEAMFYGTQSEKLQYSISNLRTDGFFTLLRYLYTQAASLINIPQALHTRTAAETFRVSKLVEACDAFLGTSMQPADVCYVLEYTIAKGSTKTLDGLIDKHLKENAEQVLKCKEFIAASQETVLKILKNPCLRIREYDVIEAVYSWATVHCAQASDETPITALRRTVRPFLPELRLLSLTPLEFVEGPSCWQILTKRDTLDVLSNIIKPGSERLPEGICANRERRTNSCGRPGLPALAAPRALSFGAPHYGK
ncbi:BTB/POZ domain-containing protein 9-like [Ixodes scapularis]|uniref:BTB/POZ domain-containing protein 9-like n=1 Tax=Ixodes scapularis TaxID=6945 RepID=UPI001C38D6FA|nr:BTB/POZ domain-containing protein 9-like [Ixodes scapularis]